MFFEEKHFYTSLSHLKILINKYLTAKKERKYLSHKHKIEKKSQKYKIWKKEQNKEKKTVWKKCLSNKSQKNKMK